MITTCTNRKHKAYSGKKVYAVSGMPEKKSDKEDKVRNFKEVEHVIFLLYMSYSFLNEKRKTFSKFLLIRMSSSFLRDLWSNFDCVLPKV